MQLVVIQNMVDKFSDLESEKIENEQVKHKK